MGKSNKTAQHSSYYMPIYLSTTNTTPAAHPAADPVIGSHRVHSITMSFSWPYRNEPLQPFFGPTTSRAKWDLHTDWSLLSLSRPLILLCELASAKKTSSSLDMSASSSTRSPISLTVYLTLRHLHQHGAGPLPAAASGD